MHLPGLCSLSCLNSIFEFLWRVLYVKPNRSLIQLLSVSAGALNNSWKVRVQNICIHLAGCQYENHPLPSKKNHAQIRAGKQTWQYKAVHSTKNPVLILKEDYVLRRKIIPNLLFHMVISHLFSAVECLALLLHWRALGLWHFPLSS